MAQDPTRVSASAPLYGKILDFYNEEVSLLDHRKFDEWLERLDDDVIYALPVRMSNSGGQTQAFGDKRSGYFDESKKTLAFRIANLEKPNAWGEAPPGRVRRFISGLQVTQNAADELQTSVNFQVTSMRDHDSQPEILVGERRDTLAMIGDTFKVKRRDVLIDNGTLPARAVTVPI